ncbi:MAG: hypothetical protein KC493_08560 [Bacteriovoracaceae bacterium]|nr:hypothetical protein [Bacteriovoracaceae bacterium]
MSSFLLFVSSGFALECPSNFKTEDVAMEMIKAEFSGIQIEGMRNHSCMNQDNFPHLLVESDVSNDEVKRIFAYVKDMKDVRILKIETIDPTVYSYKASFEVTGRTKSGKEKFKRTENISFFLYKGRSNQRVYGCGGILQHPENIYLFSKCKIK